MYFIKKQNPIKINISMKEEKPMKQKIKKMIATLLSICTVVSGIQFVPSKVKAADTLINVANNRNGYTFMTSNANTSAEGFLYVGNGFSQINSCNENLTNGNNLLGKTATTTEAAIYVDLGKNYDISSAVIYQGSTNADFYDSYCRNYNIYYSTERVSAANTGNITWNLAGTCKNGTIYNGAKVKNAEYVSDSGDEILFDETYNARSVKIVFDKNACMGTGTNGNSTGTTGTVSLLSVRVYGVESTVEDTTEGGSMKPENSVTDVLFIGNSMTYYNTLCNVVQGIAMRKGHNIRCKAATNGGKNLLFQSTAENVINAIKAGDYDIVVLQDIVGSFNGDNLQLGAEAIIPTIKQYNPNARIIFYEPWPTKDTILGVSGLLPYFTYSYIQTAKVMGADLAPAGEAFYELYADNGLNYYCNDGKHPQPLGTFTSASSIYYAMYPEEAYEGFALSDQDYLDNLINTNVAYTNEGVQSTYSIDTLNLIFSLGYQYAHAVIPAVAGKETYTSVAGSYTDPDAGLNPDNLSSVRGEVVDVSAFTKENGNMAVGCKAYASNEKQSAVNAVDGNTGSRWETEYSDPQWLYVDLGEKKDISKVGFMWEGAYASKYYIQISDDAKEWKTVAYVRATANSNVQIDLGETYYTRYVRMYGTKRGTGYGYSVYEMGVWNIPKEIETTTSAPVEVTTKEQTTTGQTETTTKEQTTTGQTENMTSEQIKTTEEVQKTENPTETKAAQNMPTSKETTNKNEKTKQPAVKKSVKVAKVKKATKKKAVKKIKISLKKLKKVTGYQVYILTKKKSKKVLVRKFVKKTNFTLKSSKFENRKKLFVKVRAYVTADGKRKYGKWSKIKKVKIKK